MKVLFRIDLFTLSKQAIDLEVFHGQSETGLILLKEFVQ